MKALIFGLVTLMGLNSATASELQLRCVSRLGSSGSVDIDIIPAAGRRNLAVLKINGRLATVGMDSPKGIAHIDGTLGAQISERLEILASGTVFNADDGDNDTVLINPQGVTIQGNLNGDDGSIHLSLMDEDRVFQHGFGLFLLCRER